MMGYMKFSNKLVNTYLVINTETIACDLLKLSYHELSARKIIKNEKPWKLHRKSKHFCIQKLIFLWYTFFLLICEMPSVESM